MAEFLVAEALGDLEKFKKSVGFAYAVTKPALAEARERSNMPEAETPINKFQVLLGFAKKLKTRGQEAQACTIEIDLILDKVKLAPATSNSLDGRKSVLVQRIERVLEETENVMCMGPVQLVDEFRHELVVFQRQDLRHAKLQINKKEVDQKKTRRLLYDTETAIEATGDQPVEPVSDLAPEPVSGFVSFLVRCGITIGKKKLREKVEDKLLALEEEQQACVQAKEVVEQLQSTAESVWAELGNCTTFTIAVREILTPIGGSLPHLQYGEASWALEALNAQLLQVLSLVEGYQTAISDVLEMTPLSDERSMEGDITTFNRQLKGISKTLSRLNTAEGIVRNSGALLLKTNKLTECIAEQLRKIKEVYTPWNTYSRSISTAPLDFISEISDMTRNADSFAWEAQPLCAEIKLILKTEFHYKRSKRAQRKQLQEKEDKTSGIQEFQRVATQQEALEVLEGLIVTLKGISAFATEFGMALLYFDRRTGSNHTPTAGGLLQPSIPFPKNPFAVNSEIVKAAQLTLDFELGALAAILSEHKDK